MMSSKYQKGMLWKPLRHLMAKAKARRAAQQAQGTQVNQPADTTFANVSHPTPMERFLQDHPANPGTNGTEVFGMSTNPPYSAGMAIIDPQASELTSSTDALAQGEAPRNFSQDGSSNMGMNWALDQTSLGNNDPSVFNFGWSPSMGDFNVRGEPFQRFLTDIQEEWF